MCAFTKILNINFQDLKWWELNAWEQINQFINLFIYIVWLCYYCNLYTFLLM